MAECTKCGKKIPFLMGCSDKEDNEICRYCWDKLYLSEKGKKDKKREEIKKQISQLDNVNPFYWIKVGFYLAGGFFLFNFLVGLIIYLLFWGTILSFLK